MRSFLTRSTGIIFFLFTQFVIASYNALFSDLVEANAAAFVIMPGTISLLYLLLPFNTFCWGYRLGCMAISILLTCITNQWHLVDGNKEWVLIAQVTLFMTCMGLRRTAHRKRYLSVAALLLILCAMGVTWQCWLESQFHNANVCIVDDGRSCGASGRCYQYYAANRCDTNKVIIPSLFESEEYVNIWYSLSEGIPVMNFEGMKGKSEHYFLCGMSLEYRNPIGRIQCN